MTSARLVAHAPPTTNALDLTLSGAKLILKSYFAGRRAGFAVAGEMALYAHLVTRALKREADWVQVATAVLARELDVNERTVTRWLGALREAGWIERRATSRGDGTLEIARTRMPALARQSSTPTPRREQPADVAALAQGGQGTEVTEAEIRPVLEALRDAPELRAIGDRATRTKVTAEIVYAVTRCALSRLPTLPLRINVARKKLRERQWRTPRTMPPDFHARFARFTAPGLEAPASPTVSAPVVTTPLARTESTARDFLAQIAAKLDSSHPTRVSEKKPLLEKSPTAGCCATSNSETVP